MMASLLVVAAVAIVVVVWQRAVRRHWLLWAEQVALAGVWRWQDADGSLEFRGGPLAGEYRQVEQGRAVSGRWRLDRHLLVLEAGFAPPERLDLRLFRPGVIGLDGPGREGRIYRKSGVRAT